MPAHQIIRDVYFVDAIGYNKSWAFLLKDGVGGRVEKTFVIKPK